jgi:hypothetical protein
MRKKIFTLLICLTIQAVCVTGAFAQMTISASMALSSVKDVNIDGNIGEGEGVKRSITSETGWGGNLLIDYLLPAGVPLSLGVEVGVNSSVFKITRYEIVEIPGYTGTNGWVEGTTEEITLNKWEDSIAAIPLLFRAAYHFDLLPKLDLYLVGKIGYVIGIWNGGYKNWEEQDFDSKIEPVGGLGYGVDAGVAYYFNSKLGLFVEAGFDQYALKTRVTGKEEAGEDYEENSWDYTINVPFNRIVTFGFSAKL